MKKASKVLLIIEAVMLATLTIEGLIILLSITTSFAVGIPALEKCSFIEFLLATGMVCALISGWRIFGWVVTNGPTRGIRMNPAWWLFAAIGAALAVLSQFDSFHELLGFALDPPSVVLGLAQLGIVFLVPFGHLVLEAIWQRRIYTRQLSIGLSRHDA